MRKFRPKKVEKFTFEEWNQRAFVAIINKEMLKKMLTPRQFDKIKNWKGVIVFDSKYFFSVGGELK